MKKPSFEAIRTIILVLLLIIEIAVIAILNNQPTATLG